MAGMRQDNAASVRGVALRVTKLDASGAPAVGTDCDVYMTGGFINFTFTPQYSTGDEIEIKSAAGEVCVYFKMPDTLKNITVGLEICDPDPILTNLLVGGVVLTEVADGSFMPVGTVEGDTIAVGYVAEKTGIEANPYGVAVEVWANAIVGGKSAAGRPFWHYLVPYAKFKLDGDRVVENGNLATVFSGNGGGNAEFGTGPNMDLTDVTPTVPAHTFDWGAPAYTDRAFGYIRGASAPVGLKGCFDNLGIALTGITSGAPASLTPTNGNRPANLTALQGLGALGSSTRWTTGNYVTLGDATEAFWTGTAWAAGRATALVTATGATAGTPGTFTPNGATPPANLAAMSGKTASPTTAWTTGQHVVLGDNSHAYWNGTAWTTGNAP